MHKTEIWILNLKKKSWNMCNKVIKQLKDLLIYLPPSRLYWQVVDDEVDVSGNDMLCGVEDGWRGKDVRCCCWLFDVITVDFMGGTTAIWLIGPLKSPFDEVPLPLMTVPLLTWDFAVESGSPPRDLFLAFVW